MFNVSGRFVYLVDCDDDRNTCCLSMVYCLYGLRHHMVIGCDHHNNHIGDLGSSCTHGGEGLVTGRVKECNVSAVWKVDFVCAHMLCDTAGFTCDDVGVSYVVKQGSLAVVNVSHNCYDRVARYVVGFIVFDFLISLMEIRIHKLYLVTEFFGYNRKCLGIETLVDGNDNPEVHTYLYDIGDRNVHQGCQFVDSDKLCDFYD